MSANVVIYTKDYCPYCEHAKQLLDSKNVSYTQYAVDKDPAKLEEMLRLSNNRRTVPQIFINDQHIGGFDDLAALEKAGKLDALLARDS